MTISSSRPVRVAVVGAGQMGANHCRVYNALKGADLVGVFDLDRGRSTTVANLNECEVFRSLEELAGAVDAATVAVPSACHAEVGTFLLERGIHCLIEKPLAMSETDALSLIDTATRSGVTLLVGHIERFNPAVCQLKEILADRHEILALDARRMSAVSSRVLDVDVVLDLMVHDLDIVLDLVGGTVVNVVARGVTVAGSPGPDYVTALLEFDSGCVASLTASRITQNQIRSLEVTTNQRFLTVDYSAQELLIYRQGRIGELNSLAPDGSYVLDVGRERVFVRRVEPLAEELSHFLSVVRGDSKPTVDGASALLALQLVWEIQQQVRKGDHR